MKTTVEIKKMGINGEGIGYINRKIVFIKGALLNEEVEIDAKQYNNKNYYFGDLDVYKRQTPKYSKQIFSTNTISQVKDLMLGVIEDEQGTGKTYRLDNDVRMICLLHTSAKGMFVNNKVEEEPKEKMTFMEKLAAMSPEEDVKKAEEFLQQESEEMEEKQAEEITETKEIVETVEENPVEDIEETDTFIEDEEEIIENKGESKVVKVMNVIIVILVIIFIALLGVILYQSFF